MIKFKLFTSNGFQQHHTIWWLHCLHGRIWKNNVMYFLSLQKLAETDKRKSYLSWHTKTCKYRDQILGMHSADTSSSLIGRLGDFKQFKCIWLTYVWLTFWQLHWSLQPFFCHWCCAKDFVSLHIIDARTISFISTNYII